MGFVYFNSPGSAKRLFARIAGHEAGATPVNLLRPGLSALTDPAAGTFYAEVEARYHRALGRALTPGEERRYRRYGAAYLPPMIRRFQKLRPEFALVWNGSRNRRLIFAEAARRTGTPLVRLELSPIPGRLVADPKGLWGECALSREAEPYRRWAADRGGDLSAWRADGDQLVARKPSRPRPADGGRPPPDGPFVFVPLQVPGDSQVVYGGGWVGSMEGMIRHLARAAAHLPSGWHLRLKEHPSARVSLAPALAALAGTRAYLDNATDTFAQVRAAGAVLTLNSSVGLQSFYFDKPVLTLGDVHFAVPGLSHPVRSEAALDEAFAGIGEIGFDPGLRDAFMSYLREVYLIRADLKTSPHIAPGEIARLLARGRSGRIGPCDG